MSRSYVVAQLEEKCLVQADADKITDIWRTHHCAVHVHVYVSVKNYIMHL